MNIRIYRSQTEPLIRQKLLPVLLQRLPAPLHTKAARYKSELSAYNYVIGRLLLKRGLDAYGVNKNLKNIEFQENGKPVIPGFYFNISHSDHQVICGFSTEGQLGVDVEKIAPIDFEDFTMMFSDREWAAIKSAEEPMRSFYWFWTRKESIIKALGLSLAYLHQIELDVTSDHMIIKGKTWFLHEIDLGNEYVAALCSEEEMNEFELTDINLSDF